VHTGTLLSSSFAGGTGDCTRKHLTGRSDLRQDVPLLPPTSQCSLLPLYTASYTVVSRCSVCRTFERAQFVSRLNVTGFGATIVLLLALYDVITKPQMFGDDCSFGRFIASARGFFYSRLPMTNYLNYDGSRFRTRCVQVVKTPPTCSRSSCGEQPKSACSCLRLDKQRDLSKLLRSSAQRRAIRCLI